MQHTKMVYLFLFLISIKCETTFAEETPDNFKIAFIGDQGVKTSSEAVLSLIKSEGAHAVVHAGDFDYRNSPPWWDNQINTFLGPDFPYFAVVGNHDEQWWDADPYGRIGYQQFIIDRFNRLGISWVGDLGIQCSFEYKGIFFVLTAPGIRGQGHADFIKDQLGANHAVWSISCWHKNQRLMQAGNKSDETGWEVYEESRNGGAIIATGHEHSYSRTHLMSSLQNQVIASTSDTLNVSNGKTFAFVSGLGGFSTRTTLLDPPDVWWASTYSASDNANFGALFGVFNVNGIGHLSYFYFKDIDGKIIDKFWVQSHVNPVSKSQVVDMAEDTQAEITLSGETNHDTHAIVTTLPAKGFLFQTTDGISRGEQILNVPTTVTHETNLVIYVPIDNESGIGYGTFGFKLSNSQATSEEALVTVNVSPVNDDPPIASDDVVTTEEDIPIQISVLDNDHDPDGDLLTVLDVSRALNGTVSINEGGILGYSPSGDFNGTDFFRYTVGDGNGNVKDAEVQINVLAVNDSPVVQDDTTVLLQDQATTIAVLDNDFDKEGDNIRIVSVSQPQNGSVKVRGDVILSYTPNPGFYGKEVFFYTVSDVHGASATAAVKIEVMRANETPFAMVDSVIIEEGGRINLDVVANDMDSDGDSLWVVSVEQGLISERVVINSDGTVHYRTIVGKTGIDSFDYIITDGFGGIVKGRVIIAVFSKERLLKALNDTVQTPEDTSVEIMVLANDILEKNDTVRVISVTDGQHGGVAIIDSTSVLFDPLENYYGLDQFRYVLSNGATTSEALVIVEVTPVDDSPMIVADTMTTDMNVSVVIDVLSNDYDVDGDLLDVYEISQGISGQVEVLELGHVMYHPRQRFIGEDTFTYGVRSQNRVAIGIVTVIVRALEADFNQDGFIDFFDFLLFAPHFGKSLADDLFEPVFDLNADDKIDLEDFIKFVRFF